MSKTQKQDRVNGISFISKFNGLVGVFTLGVYFIAFLLDIKVPVLAWTASSFSLGYYGRALDVYWDKCREEHK